MPVEDTKNQPACQQVSGNTGIWPLVRCT